MFFYVCFRQILFILKTCLTSCLSHCSVQLGVSLWDTTGVNMTPHLTHTHPESAVKYQRIRCRREIRYLAAIILKPYERVWNSEGRGSRFCPGSSSQPTPTCCGKRWPIDRWFKREAALFDRDDQSPPGAVQGRRREN